MHKLLQTLTPFVVTLLLSACGTDDGSSNSTKTSSTTLPGSESVALSWVAPSSRSDGSVLALSELAGYRVYMGTSSTNLSPLYDVEDGSVTEFTVVNLTSGSYYFAISALDMDGLESTLSQVVLKQAG
jgi:hypothetical protein